MEYPHLAYCESLFLQVLHHDRFGIEGPWGWPYSRLEAEFVFEDGPNCENADELIMDLSSIIYDDTNPNSNYYHICVKDLFKGGPSFFDDWVFNSGNLKIRDWSYGTIFSSALLYSIREDLESYLRNFEQCKSGGVSFNNFTTLNWLYVLQFCINEKVGPTVGSLLNEFNFFFDSYYIMNALSSLITSIETSPRYNTVFDHGSGTNSFIEKGLVNFLTLFKVDIVTACRIAKKVVETKSTTELIVFLKKYKLELELEVEL